MARREFPKAVKVEAFKRAGGGEVGPRPSPPRARMNMSKTTATPDRVALAAKAIARIDKCFDPPCEDSCTCWQQAEVALAAADAERERAMLEDFPALRAEVERLERKLFEERSRIALLRGRLSSTKGERIVAEAERDTLKHLAEQRGDLLAEACRQLEECRGERGIYEPEPGVFLMPRKHLSWQDHDTAFMLSIGVRYCLGRETYAPALCCHWLREQWPDVPKAHRTMIVRDIREHLDRTSRLGPDMREPEDIASTWRQFVDWAAVQPESP